MSGAVKSAGGFLGLTDGPTVQTQTDNPYISQLGDYLNSGNNGSDAANKAVMSSPVMQGLFGNGGQMAQAQSQLNKLNHQGFQLTPEDHTMYGQASDQIARQYGQSGNDVANNLAMRGLASAPSGAAGAMFSGVQGGQNEALARAQEGIMQQRFQNTMQQIGQNQKFVSSLGSLGNEAVNQQRQGTMQGFEGAAGLKNQQNTGANQANLGAAEFAQANKPANFMDYTTAGLGSSQYNAFAAPGQFVQSAAGGAGSGAGKAASSSLFG